MTRPSRRVADYAPSTLERSAELVLAAVEEAVALLRRGLYRTDNIAPPTYLPERVTRVEADHRHRATMTLYAAATAADLILGRAR